MAYSTEELWFPEWEHGGTPWENPEDYEQFNPVDHVGDWKTPMLVVHGAARLPRPVEQGIATFTALQRRGVPSEFLYFPDENHWVLKPQNSLQWHEAVERWLRNGPAPRFQPSRRGIPARGVAGRGRAAGRPCCQRCRMPRASFVAGFISRACCRRLRGQLDHVAVRVAEVDRVHELVVGDAAASRCPRALPFASISAEPRLLDLERDVQVEVVLRLELEGHVRRLEERQVRTVVEPVEGVQHRVGRPVLVSRISRLPDSGRPRKSS